MATNSQAIRHGVYLCCVLRVVLFVARVVDRCVFRAVVCFGTLSFSTMLRADAWLPLEDLLVCALAVCLLFACVLLCFCVHVVVARV